MNDRIRTVMAAPIRECFGLGSPHEWLATRILAALKAARIAVVELTERGDNGWPVDPDDDDFHVAPVHLVDQRTGQGLTGCRITWGSMELNLGPTHAQRLAVSLLSALAAAETSR
ncbi:hypothetical protein [Mycolicibacterium fortuitum]|uniref:hypothetical protein n=1 Tax=Mycolicibacterium fortuitum TaxID=1766 RepID=UPI001AEFC169|nr:hypothetical protein [Mycolicibacterium fortuitum]MBP3087005.1 hypothetical protein [Mycolicibacterium fortuitum]